MVEKTQSHYKVIARVAKNSTFVFFARITDLLITLVSTALIARYLGVTDFGYFAFVMAVTIFLLPLSDFGFERIITREIAEDSKKADRYVGSAVIARIFLSVVIIILIFIMTAFANWNDNVTYAIYISTLAQLITSMSMLAIGTFRAFERMEYELIFNFIFNIINILLLLFVIKLDLGFLFIFGARFLASLLYVFILWNLAIHKFVKPVFTIDLKLIKYLFMEALPLGIFSFLLTASFKVDVFVLNYFKTPDDVSLFEAANRVIMQLQAFPTAIVISLFPYFSRLARESTDSLRFSFNRSFKFMLIISLPIPILLIFLSNPIISIMYGKTFLPASSALKIQSIAISFLFLISLQSFVLVSKGRQILNTVTAGISFILNLILDILFIPTYGFIGASYATLISYAVFFALSLYFISKVVGMPPVGEIFPKPLISVAVTAVICLFLYDTQNLFLRVAEAFFLMAIYIAMVFLLHTFKSDEISIIKSVFIRRRLQEKIT